MYALCRSVSKVCSTLTASSSIDLTLTFLAKPIYMRRFVFRHRSTLLLLSSATEAKHQRENTLLIALLTLQLKTFVRPELLWNKLASAGLIKQSTGDYYTMLESLKSHYDLKGDFCLVAYWKKFRCPLQTRSCRNYELKVLTNPTLCTVLN